MSDIVRSRSVRDSVILRDLCCIRCGSLLKLECHHICPVSEGGDDTLDNCTTLCSDCHKEWHRLGIDSENFDGWKYTPTPEFLRYMFIEYSGANYRDCFPNLTVREISLAWIACIDCLRCLYLSGNVSESHRKTSWMARKKMIEPFVLSDYGWPCLYVPISGELYLCAKIYFGRSASDPVFTIEHLSHDALPGSVREAIKHDDLTNLLEPMANPL